MRLTVGPAYGRDYTNKKEVMADWEKDKDFIIMDVSSPWNGKYINKDQTNPGDVITIRYKKLTLLCIVKV